MEHIVMKKTLPALIVLALLLLPASGAAGTPVFTPRGIGGGGGLFSPAISDQNPDLCFVASDMSGVYKTTDGGNDWSMIPSRELSGTAGRKPPAFFENAIYWYTTYDVYESRDQGDTWKKMKWPWKPRRKITGLTACRTKGEYLFVSTTEDLWRYDLQAKQWNMVLEGKCLPPVALGSMVMAVSDNRLMRSTDLGGSWQQAPGFKAEGRDVLAFTGATDGSETLLLATLDGLGITRSTDSGDSWARSAPFLHQGILQMTPGQTRIAWAVEQKKNLGKKLWKTENSGRDWKEVFRFAGNDRNVEYSWVQTEMRWGYFITKQGFFASRTDPDTAIVTTQGDLYRTTDGGRSWRSLINRPMGFLPDGKTPRFASVGLEMTTCYQYLFDPWEPERHYAAFADFGFIRSLDRGKTWSHATKGSPWSNTFYRVRFDPKTPGRLYAAAANRHDIPNWGQIGWYNAKYNVGGPLISQDFGATWSRLGTGFPNAPCTDILVTSGSSEDSRILYAGAYGKGVFKSEDGGKTWTDITGNIRKANLHAYRLWRSPDSGDLYCLITALRGKGNVITPGGIWKSADKGTSWSEITSDFTPDWPTAFHVDSKNENTIYVAVASVPAKRPQQGGIWKTVDGGKDWSHVLRDRSFKPRPYDRMMAVTVHPQDSSLVYAGGFLNGLWFSRNGGADWEKYEAFPFRSVQSVNFNPQDPKQIVVTTFGGGLWAGPYLPPE